MIRRKIPVWAAGISVLLILAVVTAAFILDRKMDKQPEADQEPGKTVEDMLGINDPPVYYAGRTYHRNRDVESYLMLGIDRPGRVQAGEYNDGGQSDVLLLLVIDHAQKCFTTLQINRDTMTSVNALDIRGEVIGEHTEQIALAHAYGNGLKDSCRNAADAVSGLLYDMPVDGYLSLRMDAIPVMNDMLGGVTVLLEDDFTDYDPSWEKGSEVCLKGEEVEAFIRARMSVGDGSNLSRMRRHRTYMTAFQKEMHQQMETDSELFLRMFDAVSEYMVTNMGSKTMTRISEYGMEYQNNGILTVAGEAKQGQTYIEYYPDEENLKETVLQLFYIKEE